MQPFLNMARRFADPISGPTSWRIVRDRSTMCQQLLISTPPSVRFRGTLLSPVLEHALSVDRPSCGCLHGALVAHLRRGSTATSNSLHECPATTPEAALLVQFIHWREQIKRKTVFVQVQIGRLASQKVAY